MDQFAIFTFPQKLIFAPGFGDTVCKNPVDRVLAKKCPTSENGLLCPTVRVVGEKTSQLKVSDANHPRNPGKTGLATLPAK